MTNSQDQKSARMEKNVRLLTLCSIIFLLLTWSNDLTLVSQRVEEKERSGKDQHHNETKREPSLSSLQQPLTLNQRGPRLDPPTGFPWHKWSFSKPGIPTSTIIDMLKRENENAQCLYEDPNKTTRRCESQVHVIPYLVRNGTILASQTKRDVLLKYRNTITPRLRIFENMLSSALEIAKRNSLADYRMKQIAEGDFPVVLRKDDRKRCEGARPVLSWSRLENDALCTSFFPIPSYNLWAACAKKSSQEWDEQHRILRKKYPWENKKRLAAWRGSPTGHSSTHRWEDLPRVQLVKRGMERPDLIDAGFVNTSRATNVHETEMRKALRFAERIPEEEFMEYIAIVDIDGNSWSSRFGRLLCYNSVVLKVRPSNVDYFHPELKPWKHYIPVHANMSNIEEVADYVLDKNNSREVKQIIENANNWCRDKLTWTRLATDLLWTLISYIELLEEGNKDWHKTWKSNEEAYNLPALKMVEAKTRKERPLVDV